MLFKQKQIDTSIESLPGHYKSLESVYMYNYYKVEETGDLRYLYKLDDYDDLPELETEHLKEVWESMQMEAQQIAVDNNPRLRNIFELQAKIVRKKADFDLIQILLPRLWDSKNDEFVQALSDLGYRINPKRDYHMEIKRISKQSQNLKTKIKQWEDEYNELTKSDGKTVSIHTEINNIERYLNSIGSIDIRKTTMIKWLTLKHQVNIESIKKQSNGR